MSRPLAVALLASLAILAGCQAPSNALSTPAPMANATADAPAASETNVTPRSDPSTDRLGWEGGYWYDDPIAIDAGDGLNGTELSAVVNRSMARVERIRRLEFERTVPVSIVSRETFRNRSDSNASATIRVFDDVKFEALFLVGERESSLETQERNREIGVRGYYSPVRDEIVVVSGSGTASLSERTLAHELVHALQDAHFDPKYSMPTREARNAVLGVIEGDARHVDRLYQRRCDGAWSCVRPGARAGSGGGGGNASGVHRGIYLMKYFPYSDGAAFVRHVRKRGGWEAVNDLYADFPASAEQVIYPEKYGEDAPRDVRLPDRSSRAWERVTPKRRAPYAELGQPSLVATFAYPTYHGGRRAVLQPSAFLNLQGMSIDRSDPIDYDVRYASGWDGDKLWVYRNGEATGYVWRLVWDSRADAREFAAGYRRVLRYWGAERVRAGVWRIPEDASAFADAFSITVRGDTVTIVNAPTTGDLDAVHSPAG